jgi:hypothetical protein
VEIPPHPKFEQRSNFDLSPQAGRGKKRHPFFDKGSRVSASPLTLRPSPKAARRKTSTEALKKKPGRRNHEINFGRGRG